MAKAKKKPTKKPATKKPAAKKPATKKASKPAKPAARTSLPRSGGRANGEASMPGPTLFRINLEVGDLDRAEALYNTLLGVTGRRQAGARVYYTCGGVTIQMVDVTGHGEGTPHPAAKALYFLVDDLDGVHARAAELGVLSTELVHSQVGGEISVRPWGERSFYAEDLWTNPLCFVQTGTTYPG